MRLASSKGAASCGGQAGGTSSAGSVCSAPTSWATRRDGRASEPSLCRAKLKVTTGAVASRRVVMARASSQSNGAVPWGMSKSRCTSGGSRGCVAPLGGQWSSSAPRNQTASAARPADSAGPAMRMGASRDCGANSVSSSVWASAERKSCQEVRRPSKPREPHVSTAFSQRSAAWNSALESGRSPGQPVAASNCGTRAAQSSGVWVRPWTALRLRWASIMRCDQATGSCEAED